MAIVPESLDGQLASTGFIVIRPEDYDEACLLYSIFKSDLIQKQFLRICSGYTQREMSDEYLKKYLIIPIPKDRDELIKKIKKNFESAKHSRDIELAMLEEIKKAPLSIL